jgi:hypothetical protein
VRDWTSRRRGHTLAEIIMASGLLLTMLALVSAPILLTTRAMQNGQAKIESQHQVREPVDRLFTELRNGFSLEFSAVDEATGSNSVTFYDSKDTHHYQILYQLDSVNHQITRTVSQWNTGTSYSTLYGGAVNAASGVTLLNFQPMYNPEEDPTSWLPYTLPLPDPSVTTSLPPHSKNHPPLNTLVLVRVVGQGSDDAPGLDLSTSFYVRN